MNLKNSLITLFIIGTIVLFVLGMLTPGGDTFLNNSFLNAGFILTTLGLFGGIVISDFGNDIWDTNKDMDAHN